MVTVAVFVVPIALIYNLAARWVGGIEVQVESVAPPPPLPAWGTASQAPPSGAPPAPTARPPDPPPG